MLLKKPHIVGLGATAVLALVLLNLPAHTSSRLKLAISSFFLPLVGLTSTAEKVSDATGARLLPKSVLIAEVEKLRRENDELKIETLQTRELARENAALRDAVSWQKKLPWKTRLAQVISRDPANWWRSIEINLGSKDGLVKDLPVITPMGLVGRVDDVGKGYARVVLLGDPQCKVPAVVDNAARDTGQILPGDATVLDESIVEMTYITRHSQAIPGQKVFTSGLDGVFPKGIPIGHITDTNSVGYGLYLEARVKLSANLHELEEVFVLFP
jgi:rod shape-determining protein MreC